jgi:ankyrin repeat protein
MAKDIHNAAGYGSEKEVSRFLNQGVSVDLADHEGAAPLARAARFGHLAVAELLLT